MTLTRRNPPLGAMAPADHARRRDLEQPLRCAWRVAAIVAVTLPAMALQALFLTLPGGAKRRFARFYWATLSRVMGLQRNVIGTVPPPGARPVLFVSNHTSWLDILSLGGTLQGCFVAKGDVAAWPVVGLIARLGRTVFVSRRAGDTGRERDDMRGRLAAGDALILFPEGTSSDGARTLPFRSPFFSVAERRDGESPPLIQPVSVVYDRVDGLPVGRAARPLSSWYGDMDLGGHFWRLARHRRIRVTILLHPPVDPLQFRSRKELSASVWQVIAAGAAVLRQNRPVRNTGFT